MDLDELRQEWPILEPQSYALIAIGINNLTRVVETPGGDYILRTYSSDRSIEHIRYELGLLKILQEQNLPFQIPAPIATAQGELFVNRPDGMMTLSLRLPGSIPQNGNLEQAFAAGQALAELVKTLSTVQLEATSQLAPFPPSDDFEGWAGVPVIPAKIISELSLTREEQWQLLSLIDNTVAFAPALYGLLPQQILHRDYDQSNILMEGNLVTGVLDFEFCGPDLRILDLAYALSKWPYGLWGTGQEWSVLDAFGRGYLDRQRLLLAELEALPNILRLRATTSLFFRFGRYQQGLETVESLLEQIHEALHDERWLDGHEEELMSHVQGWYH